MGMFKKSCYTNVNVTSTPNPDPSRFRILDTFIFANAYVLYIEYFDCTNFEGRKILVYEGNYVKRNRIDPHFSRSNNSPIARFKPTTKGLRLALSLAQNYEL